MKNYRKSDYAINKYSNGIVYRFANLIVEIKMMDYLIENPDKTEQDFWDLKTMSDAIYLEQDRAENAQTRKNVSIDGMENHRNLGTALIEDEYIEILDRQHSLRAFQLLLESGTLTEVQRRRFIMRICSGLSHRQIAERERVTYHAVAESLRCAVSKLRKIFEKF